MRWALALWLLPAALRAQQDTTALETIVVSAERTRGALGSATVSVTRIEAADLARIPHATIADVLRHVPGFAVVDFDGLGRDPQVMARGFYGGGEAEYVIVLVDGQRIDQLQSGIVPWDALPPLSAVEAIEILRGGSSALYGDAAVGAVINVITRRGGAPRLSVSGGTFQTYHAEASVGTFSGAVDRTKGYRRHSERTAARGRAVVRLADSLTLVANAHWREFDEPGALRESLLLTDRRQSDSLFRFDNSEDQAYALTLTGDYGPARASFTADSRRTDALRTLVLAPDVGDSKQRVVDARRVAGGVQLNVGDLLLGMDASYGALDSKYYEVAGGERGALSASGNGRRASGAVFAQYAALPLDGVRLTLGVRGDWIGDSFDDEGASHTALSPRIGVNVALIPGVNMYATAGTSFKAATLDQLFDQRAIPVPFPPFSVTTSNAQLEPQRGRSVEAGVHVVQEGLTANATAYQMDMKDELDFDVNTLRYVNIGRSRHRGLEFGGRYETQPGVAVFMNRTIQQATARSGANAGKYLKAIPRRITSGGFSAIPFPWLELSTVYAEYRQIFLDDANTRRIADYSRFDLSLDVRLASDLRFTLAVRNATRVRYNTTGFPDPGGGSDAYFFPAATRSLQLGMRYGW